MLRFRFRNVYNEIKFNQARRSNPFSNRPMDHPHGTDQYTAHSPLFMSRFRSEEMRSRIFFEHPPVPNRYAKYFTLFCFCAVLSTGFRDKVQRRYKR